MNGGSGATDATIRHVSRPRQEVTPAELGALRHRRRSLDSAQENYRALVVSILARGASFAEVSKATGLSTNTLQRWKREALQTGALCPADMSGLHTFIDSLDGHRCLNCDLVVEQC